MPSAHPWLRIGIRDFYMRIVSILGVVMTVVMFGAPSFIYAQCPPTCVYTNPIVSGSDFVTILTSVSETLRLFFLPLAAFGIVVMGLWLIIAAASGNQAQVQNSKKFLFWAVIGAAIIAGAVVLVEAARQFAASLGGP